MNWIDKNKPPRSLTLYKRQQGASYEDLDGNVKKDIYASLRNEQKGVCAYCNQILKSKFKIEHHCEQSICNGFNNTTDRTLDYTNMLGVCIGKTGKMLEYHCDTMKSTFTVNNGLPISLNPLNQNHINTIEYRSSGLILSNNQRFNDEINRILNLNLKYLKDLRKEKWSLIFKVCIKNGVVNKAKLLRILSVELQENNYTQPFPGLSMFLLKKYS